MGYKLQVLGVTGWMKGRLRNLGLIELVVD